MRNEKYIIRRSKTLFHYNDALANYLSATFIENILP